MAGWIIAAIGASILFDIINNLDSPLLNRRLPSLRAFLLLTSLVILVAIQPFIYFNPIPAGTETTILVSAVVSALMRVIAIILMLFSLKGEEVVGVAPRVYRYPVLVARAAVPLLGESLTVLQWLAVIIVAGGTILVAIHPQVGNVVSTLRKKLPYIILAALLFAAADLSGKYALKVLSSYTLYWMSMLSLAVICIAFSLRSEVLRSLNNLPDPRSTALIILLNEALVVGSSTLSFGNENGQIAGFHLLASDRVRFYSGCYLKPGI